MVTHSGLLAMAAFQSSSYKAPSRHGNTLAGLRGGCTLLSSQPGIMPAVHNREVRCAVLYAFTVLRHWASTAATLVLLFHLPPPKKFTESNTSRYEASVVSTAHH